MTGKGGATYAFDVLNRLTQAVDGATTLSEGWFGIRRFHGRNAKRKQMNRY